MSVFFVIFTASERKKTTKAFDLSGFCLVGPPRVELGTNGL